MRLERGLRLAAVAFAVCAGRSGSAAAQAPPIAPGRPPEFGFAAGYGWTANSKNRPTEERYVAFVASAGFRLGNRFEYLAEADGFRFLSPDGYYVGLLPAGARLWIGNGRVLPFASLGLGLGWTDLVELPELSRRFNFQVTVGAGVRGTLSERTGWTVEARWLHISNAGTSYPNLGLNGIVLLGGIRFH